MLAEAEKLKVSETPLEPLIQGRDLITLGLKPSPNFKEILKLIYILQLEGNISKKEEALEYIKVNYLEYQDE
jgi:tRNA nucleotidyltransferase (CCA-adding enzyme)